MVHSSASDLDAANRDKNKSYLAFMPIKELEDFAIKDEERRFSVFGKIKSIS